LHGVTSTGRFEGRILISLTTQAHGFVSKFGRRWSWNFYAMAIMPEGFVVPRTALELLPFQAASQQPTSDPPHESGGKVFDREDTIYG
jgi:hypothetical protein